MSKIPTPIETNIPPPPSTPDPEANRESVIITVIGSKTGSNVVIKILHRLGFAEVQDWSKPQIDPKSGHPLRILKKWIRY